MKTEIKKLIADYEKQIKRYDYELSVIKERETEIRHNQDDTYANELDELFNTKQIKTAQRQRTVQFVVDLNFLLEI
jgi:hypothetical protein